MHVAASPTRVVLARYRGAPADTGLQISDRMGRCLHFTHSAKYRVVVSTWARVSAQVFPIFSFGVRGGRLGPETLVGHADVSVAIFLEAGPRHERGMN